ncbi:hypothetical protein I4U23_028050 [Adineta vaga]|nr:hypothetical protein I4U23_028050 [Adineta vaga]
MSTEDDIDSDPNNFISHLRTTVILAARKSSTSDIDIAAIDKIVETTVDFVKNILEHMSTENHVTSFSSDDLLNTIRLHAHLIPDRTLFFSIMETLNHR